MIVVGWGLHHLWQHPEAIPAWKALALAEHGSWTKMIGVALVLFPHLALGLSGFETGVAVMPLVSGDPGDNPKHPEGRIRNARKLLTTAALIMSVMLVGSSIVTTTLIPAEAFREGGEAYGRALAYLAHDHLGHTFGTIYDLSTVAILWFAGASALVGLLNLVPQYLPRYGMAPEWARANRPLVLIFTAITFVVTILFEADVNAQGGAYATGVLVLMGSASLAVTIAAWRAGTFWFGYLLLTLIFGYTTMVNIIDRPEGLKIANIFIIGIVISSLVSRVLRSTELRVQAVEADELARQFLAERLRRPGEDHRQPPGHRAAGRVRAQAERGDGVAPPDAGRRGDLRRGQARRRLGVQRCAAGEWRNRRSPPRAALREPGDPERDRRAAVVRPRPDGDDSARLLRVDGRESDCLPDEVPGLRRGRYGAGHARGAAAVRARPPPTAPHPRRLTG